MLDCSKVLCHFRAVVLRYRVDAQVWVGGVTGSECGKGLVQAIEKRICNVCQHHDQFNEKFYDRVWLKCAQVTTFSTNGWTDRPFNSFYSTKSLRPLCEIED